ncbi:MAG: FkbM family methyltransferase [Acidobacteria bacterium]|nr:FkbM family methyltransferase [Acidobacteriota bacterium]
MINKTARRLAHAAQAVNQHLRGAAEDVKLFWQGYSGPALVPYPVLRHRHADGLHMLVRADEIVGRSIYFFGEHERQECDFMLENVREADICIDIGANVGFYTLALAQKATKGYVHAFEPAPLSYHILSVNVLINGLTNVVSSRYAVGDVKGEADLFLASDGGFSSLVDTGRKPITGKTRTAMITLDAYCQDYELQRVDIIKADVEGAEPKVIRGARELLSDRRRRPRLIMLELNASMLHQFGSGVDEMISVMSSYGYCASICAEGRVVPFAHQYLSNFENFFFTCY